MARKTRSEEKPDKSSKGKQAQGKSSQSSRSGGPVKFAKDVRKELGKVSWPDRPQLQQSTAIVVIVVLVLMAYVAAWDFVFRNIANFIFG